MTLTEQWKKGELPYGNYYVKNIYGNVVNDIYRDNKYDEWMLHSDREICEVLAPVPSYEEWQYLLLDNKILKQCQEIDFGTAYTETVKTKAENQQFKELLKEAKDIIEWYKADCGYKDTPTEAILTKIDNAIGEKK